MAFRTDLQSVPGNRDGLETRSTTGGKKREPDAHRLFADILPDIIKLRRTQGQLERQIAVLRHVEALRQYAADHDGQLPARLSDLTVPLPPDPVTGKPFEYVVDQTTAHLRGGSLRGEEKDSANDIHYEVKWASKTRPTLHFPGALWP
jgi:hypothetical protein